MTPKKIFFSQDIEGQLFYSLTEREVEGYSIAYISVDALKSWIEDNNLYQTNNGFETIIKTELLKFLDQ